MTLSAGSYFGGKANIQKWVRSHFLPHRKYLEPLGGLFSVGINKPPADIETYNDIDGRLVNFFRVLRDNCDRLQDMLYLTPYAREEYEAAVIQHSDPIEDARRVFVLLNAGAGRVGGATKGNFLTKSKSRWDGDLPRSVAFRNKAASDLQAISNRLRHVQIEHATSLKRTIWLMKKFNDSESLIYIDMPYLHANRTSKNDYAGELSDSDHESVLSLVSGFNAQVVISHYDADMYNDILSGWHKTQKTATTRARTGNNKYKVECIWTNKARQGRLL